ncbi:MAG: hypothetical protein RI980_1168 [Bacteroidota bacterium]|jgi:hypothetical protein
MKKILNFIFDNDNYDIDYSKLFSNIITGFALLNIISVLPDIFILYSKNGISTDYINNLLITDEKLSINNLTSFLSNYNIPYHFAFISIFMIYVISLIMVLFDYFRFLCSIIIVFLHGIIINTSPLTTYGVDFMISFLLYINVFWSIKNYISNDYYKLIFPFTIRLMQIQLCIIYFFGGIGKLLGFDWFDGNSIWLSMNLYMNDELLDVIAPYIPNVIYKLIALHILFSELFFPLLVYYSKTKKWIIYNIIILHLGISFVIGLHTFSFCMIIFNIIAFYPNEFGNYINQIFKKKRSFSTNNLKI